MHSLPGKQGRNVPFVRPSKSISRQQIFVSAVPDHAIQEQSANQENGVVPHTGAVESSNGLLAVHGGEMSGRPRVSGAYVSWMGGFLRWMVDYECGCCCRFSDDADCSDCDVYF